MKYQVLNPQNEVVAEFVHDTHARLFMTQMNLIRTEEIKGKYIFKQKPRAKGWASQHWVTPSESEKKGD